MSEDAYVFFAGIGILVVVLFAVAVFALIGSVIEGLLPTKRKR